MVRDSESTRRRFLTSGALVGAGLIAGCTGGNSNGGGESTTTTGKSTQTSTGEATQGTTEGTAQGSGGGGRPYSVSMAPVGTVEFEQVPETWFAYTGDYADMGVALGRSDGLSAIGVRARFGSHLYEELPGVSVDKNELTQLWQDGTGKEVFYELDADVHLVDPNFMIGRLGWNQGDVEEIRKVAPWFGNTVFTRVYDWHEYRYYSLYEAFERVAKAFRRKPRYEAFKRYHDEVLADVEARLPEEMPSVAVLYPADIPPDSFYPYLVGSGTQSKHWRDLGVTDALSQHGITDAQVSGTTIDYETLLEIDPDVIAVRLQGEITEEYIDEEITAYMREHDVASELQAVQDDRVIYGGLTYQGPIIHLFQLERAAQELYPEAFGGDQLFDRQRVSDIVTGKSRP